MDEEALDRHLALQRPAVGAGTETEAAAKAEA